jgi:hypothetical protein
MRQPTPSGRFLLCALLVALACGTRAKPTATSTFAALGGDAAHVGDTVIPASLVADVARARGVDWSRALEELVQDALLATEARARGLDRDGSVRWASTATLARIVSERLSDAARQRGAPSDDELATVQVIHAVVLKSPTLSPSRAKDIAFEILQAVAHAQSDAKFEARAKQVPHPAAHVSVERLHEFDASGRSAEGDVYDASFVAGAFELHAPGETSGIVTSAFGWHIIRLIRRVAPDDPAVLERRREDLATDVFQLRVRSLLRDLLEARRQRAPPNISAAADDLMAKAAYAQ